MKKIILNAPRRTSSTYLSMLIKNCLEKDTDLFFEKLDSGSTMLGKISKWTTTHQNEIQVTVLRNPYDVVLSQIILLIMSSRKEGSLNPGLASTLLNDDVTFIKAVSVEIKKLEKYYLATEKYADATHLVYKFEDVTDDEKKILVIKDILQSAEYSISPEFESLFELAVLEADSRSFLNKDIVINPQNRNELYTQIQDRMASLSDSIDFTLVNAAYQSALPKAKTF